VVYITLARAKNYSLQHLPSIRQSARAHSLIF
jgi:hypothetical protein